MRKTRCNRATEYWMQFLAAGKVVAEFATTKAGSQKYGRLRSQWKDGLSPAKLRAAIERICNG